MTSVIFIFPFLFSVFFQEEIEIRKTCYAGGYITIPEGKTWAIKRVFITNNDGYNILISNTNFKSTYQNGDTIRIPYYISEMELLTNREMLQYIFYFYESEQE